MIGFLTPIATKGISYSFGFVFFGTNIAAALIVYLFLYESRTLSLEHVDLMYGQPKLKAWTSSRWVPPGHTSRKVREESCPQHMEKSDHDSQATEHMAERV